MSAAGCVNKTFRTERCEDFLQGDCAMLEKMRQLGNGDAAGPADELLTAESLTARTYAMPNISPSIQDHSAALAAVVHSVYHEEAKADLEEPDASIAHVGICGSRGQASAQDRPAG
jgi:hypothetical protein